MTAARELFSTQGLAATSTRQIASKSKVNISMISYYFGSKEGLFQGIIEDFAHNITGNVYPILDSISLEGMTPESFRAGLSKIIENMVQVRVEHADIHMMFEREKINGLKVCSEMSDCVFYPLVKKLTSLIEAAQAKKIVHKEIDPDLFFVLLYEGIQNMYSYLGCETKHATQLNKKYSANYKKVYDQVVRIYLEGLMVKK